MKIEPRDRDTYAARTRALTFAAADGGALPYRLHVPEGAGAGDRLPLLLYLHGAGERGDDNWLQLRSYAAGWIGPEVQAVYPSFVLLPQCPTGEQWVATSFPGGSYDSTAVSFSAALRRVTELLAEIVATQPVDPDRVYVMGASMGGYGAWDLVIRQPERFAAAAPICGAGDPRRAERIVGLPVWAFHGDRDDAVPVSGSREMVAAVRAAGGGAIRYTEYPDVGHESFDMAWREPDLVHWMFGQRRRSG